MSLGSVKCLGYEFVYFSHPASKKWSSVWPESLKHLIFYLTIPGTQNETQSIDIKVMIILAYIYVTFGSFQIFKHFNYI